MEMPETLPLKPSECQLLSEWRSLVIGKSQLEIAKGISSTQARVSAIETGRVIPRRKFWKDLLAAYRLEGFESDFYRMIMNARKLRVIQKPMSESEPLLAMGRADKPAVIIDSSEAIGLREQMKRVAGGVPPQKAGLA